MTALALARLPVAAGGVVLETTGNLIHWGFGRFMRAPLANSAVLAMVTFSAMAGSNALYMQAHEHPAPLFAPSQNGAARAPDVVVPLPASERPRKTLTTVEPLPAQETTGSVAPATQVAPLGNDEVTEIQRKLHAMQIFDGAIDGLYGPKTARAIKKFEERMGMRPRGELTHELLAAVRAAPVILPEPRTESTPALLPVAEPEPEPPAVTAPSVSTAEEAPAASRAVTTVTLPDIEPLPAPEPLQATIEAKPVADVTTEPKVLRRELPETPQEAMQIAVETAGDAIDTIINGVQTIAMTTPGKTPKPQQQFVARETQGAAAAMPAAADDAAAGTEPAYRVASVAEPRVGATLVVPDEEDAIETEVAVLDTDAKPEELMPPFSVTDPVMVAKVQRGLASLGFLHGPADGVAGEATAKAIRNFEVYFNYKVTGRITPELLDLLVQNGATF